MTTLPFSLSNDTRTKQPADISRGASAKEYTSEEMIEALNILAMRADFLAEELGIEDDRGPYYRDWSGTSHLLIRSVLEPLNRILHNGHDNRKAKGAASTVGFILDNPDKIDGMYCDDPLRIAKIGDKVSDVELANGKFEDAISQADLNYVVGQLYKFTYEVSQTFKMTDVTNKEDLTKFAECLNRGVKWAMQAHPKMEKMLNPDVAMALKP